MLTSHRGSAPAMPVVKAAVLVGTLIAASLVSPAAQAIGFGHSRILSAHGQPLHLEIPVTELTQQEVETLRATPAPAEAWQAAGMSPPVPLESMRLVLLEGYRPGVKVIQLRSDQASDQPIVDVLIDVRSASGQQRYQVSLVAHADRLAVQRAGSDSIREGRAIDSRADASSQGQHVAAGRQIQVRRGDTMFAIAQRNAVQGVSVYQMMIALQRSNPDAFILDNVNLVKAGATLTMPDLDVLTAISDREARRIFQQHAQAFARYRQRSGGADVASIATTGEAVAQGTVSEAAPAVEAAQAPAAQGSDRLRLSGATDTGGRSSAQGTGGTAAAAAANGTRSNGSNVGNANAAGAGGTAQDPSVNLLASSGAIASDAVPHHPDDEAATRKNIDESKTRVLELEDNVRHLNEALQKQGHVAAETALEGARSVTEAIMEAIGLTDDDVDATDAAASESGAAQGATGVTGTTGTPGTTGAAGTTGTAGAADADASSQSGGDASPGATASDATARGTAGAGAAAAPGSATSSGTGVTPSSGGSTTEAGADQGAGAATSAAGADAGATGAAGAGIASSTGTATGDATATGASAGTAASGATGVTGATGATGATGTAATNAGSGDSTGANGASTTAGAAGTTGASTESPRATGTTASSTSGQASSTPPGAASGPASTSDSTSQSSVKAQKPVSWFQENLFAVIGGGLLLLVLIVAWVLRRISASERSAFESDSPITDSMVREKLRDIDLDLDRAPESGNGRHGT